MFAMDTLKLSEEGIHSEGFQWYCLLRGGKVTQGKTDLDARYEDQAVLANITLGMHG